MENEQPESIECPAEPEAVQKARKIVARLLEFIEAADVNALSVYVEHRDGTYRTYQVAGESGKHEDAGRLLELACMRLGFVDEGQVREILAEKE